MNYNIYKNPLFYGILSIISTYIYVNYISKKYSDKYKLLCPIIIFIITIILSTVIINNYTDTSSNKIFNKTILEDINLPQSINDLPSIFVKFP